MANYSAADVKRLREQTGAGMMDCKNALVESDGDFDKAVEYLRVKGLKGVAKREGRDASNGLVAAKIEGGVGSLLKLNCETDFVAKSEPFQRLAAEVLDHVFSSGAPDAPSLLKSEIQPGKTVQQLLDEGNASIGEKIEVGGVARLEGPAVSSYLHKTNPDLPPQIGVLVVTSAESPLGRDVAMHIAALPPKYLSRDEVSEETIATERRVFEAKAREEGKPDAAIARIVEGQVNGFYKENVLLEQKFAKDQNKTVQAVLKDGGVDVVAFARLRVGG